MVRSNYAKARKSQTHGRLLCALLAITCALVLCTAGVAFSARAEEITVGDQTVDSNGFRLTYSAQNIDRRHSETNPDAYDDTSPELYSRVRITDATGVDNWGKPIDFSKRFRIQTYMTGATGKDDTAHLRDRMVFDISSTTDGASANAVSGWSTMPIPNNPTFNRPIHEDSIVHFSSNHANAWAWATSTENVIWKEQSKGFATDNVDGTLKVGHLGYANTRVYFYIFDFVSGDNEGERSTLTATASSDFENETTPDVFYLTDTQKTLAGKKGYASLNFNGKGADYYVKLVHENTLTLDIDSGYEVTKMEVGENSNLNVFDADGKWVKDYSVTPAATQKVWGGDLVKMKLTGTNPVLMVDETPVVEGADGYWSFYMPDEDITVRVEEGKTYHAVNFDTDGGSAVTTQAVLANETATKPSSDPVKAGYTFAGWYSDAACTNAYDFTTPVTEPITLYAKWTALHAVTYKIPGFTDLTAQVPEGTTAPEKNMANDVRPGTVAAERVPGWSADNLSLTWYADPEYTTEFDFTASITEPTTVYGKLVETKQYKNTGAYGWDELSTFTDDSGTEIIRGTHYATPFDVDDNGVATFNFTDQQEAIYSRALDVTKDIYFDLALTAANGSWFMIGLWDNLTLAQISYSDNYQHTYGVQAAFGIDTVSGAVHAGDSSGHDGTFADAVGGKTVHLKISIGETTSEIYKYKTVGEGEEAQEQWVKYANLNVKRSSFRDGKAYISLASFVGSQAETKIWQEIDQESVTAENDGNGTVTATVIGGGSAISVETAAKEGYELDTLTVNGKAATVNRRGYLIYDDYSALSDGITVKATFKAKSTGGDNTGDNNGDNTGNEPGDNTGSTDKKDDAGCGCGSVAGGVGAAGAAAAVLGLTGALLLIRRRKANN